MRLLTPLVISFWLLCMGQLFAQDLVVKQVSPANLSMSMEASQPIQIEFQEPIPAARLSKHISINGFFSGKFDFSYTLSNSNKTLTININEADKTPMAGELISVNIAKGIRKNNTKGYSWQFRTKTKRGTLELSRAGSLSLRQAGDTWLKTIGAYGGDLNGDNYSDLTIITENTEDLRIFLNDGSGHYGDMKVIPVGRSSSKPGKGADFNNDGDMDLAVPSTHNQLRVLLGDGSGSFYHSDKYESGPTARSLVVLDYDSDGDEDIAVANQDRLSLFTNDGSGQFRKSDIDPRGLGESCIAAVDANHDGQMDLFIGFANSNQVGLLLGDGKGGFEMSDLVKVQGAPKMMKVGDLNNDGHADVVTANTNGHLVMITFGDGTGGLYGSKAYALPNGRTPSDVELGDLDGDGDLDMISSNYESGNFAVWENNAEGVMSMVNLYAAPAKASHVLLHDRDNDGDLDFTGFDATEDVALLFENNMSFERSADEELISEMSIKVGPNPFISRLEIEIENAYTARTDIRILNGNGQTIERLYDDRLKVGKHHFGWDGGRFKGLQLPSGIYYLVVTQNGEKKTIPITKA